MDPAARLATPSASVAYATAALLAVACVAAFARIAWHMLATDAPLTALLARHAVAAPSHYAANARLSALKASIAALRAELATLQRPMSSTPSLHARLDELRARKGSLDCTQQSHRQQIRALNEEQRRANSALRAAQSARADAQVRSGAAHAALERITAELHTVHAETEAQRAAVHTHALHGATEHTPGSPVSSVSVRGADAPSAWSAPHPASADALRGAADVVRADITALKERLTLLHTTAAFVDSGRAVADAHAHARATFATDHTSSSSCIPAQHADDLDAASVPKHLLPSNLFTNADDDFLAPHAAGGGAAEFPILPDLTMPPLSPTTAASFTPPTPLSALGDTSMFALPFGMHDAPARAPVQSSNTKLFHSTRPWPAGAAPVAPWNACDGGSCWPPERVLAASSSAAAQSTEVDARQRRMFPLDGPPFSPHGPEIWPYSPSLSKGAQVSPRLW
ncbi:hypothetical protein MSPP1_001751 [Malassezia sp. CBS 17886]|nr:hypothetical protein MSPP1_001751 [Malassezia sp. CBS 17886]